MYMEVDPIATSLSTVNEYLFTNNEDGCLNVAIHPKEKAFVAAVNSPETSITAGQNENCRVFTISKSRIRLFKAVKTLDSLDPFHHQKIARFSHDGKLLATGTTDGKFTLWTWPEMLPVFAPIDTGDAEVIDVHFDLFGSSVVFITPKGLKLLDTTKGKVRWELQHQNIRGEFFDYRAARWIRLRNF